MKVETEVLGVVYVFLAFFVVVNVFNIPYPYLNPPPAPTYRTFTMIWPTAVNGVLTQGSSSITVVSQVQATGPVVEGQPIYLFAGGEIGGALAPVVRNVTVTFQGMVMYPEAYVSDIVIACCARPIGVTLTLNSTVPKFIGIIIRGSSGLWETSTQKFTWPNEGDYYPTMTIGFKNGTEIQQAYPDAGLVHVSPATLIQDAQANRIDIALTIALVVFGFMEGLSIIRDYNQPSVTSGRGPPSKSRWLLLRIEWKLTSWGQRIHKWLVRRTRRIPSR